ncbi:hypothetical protein [Corynebacterium pacaense]|uniref:hypothetical protein n=1 Tax=Corynebacterium pacaense TaxID=1816684 RepID=UPI0015C4BF85|nr:hypothetical protein [Corynebacterium pacaense]
MRRPAGVIGALALLSLATSCTIPTDTDPVPSPTSRPPQPTTAAVTPGAGPDLASAVAAVASTNGGRGGGGLAQDGQARTFGGLLDAPARSTIKVPIALAALDGCDADRASLEAQVTAALTTSDNDAAEWLWECLGDPDTAALRTGDVIAHAGTPVRVNTTVTRPGFSSFGQTEWTLPEQALFAGVLPDIAADTIVAEAPMRSKSSTM